MRTLFRNNPDASLPSSATPDHTTLSLGAQSQTHSRHSLSFLCTSKSWLLGERRVVGSQRDLQLSLFTQRPSPGRVKRQSVETSYTVLFSGEDMGRLASNPSGMLSLCFATELHTLLLEGSPLTN